MTIDWKDAVTPDFKDEGSRPWDNLRDVLKWIKKAPA